MHGQYVKTACRHQQVLSITRSTESVKIHKPPHDGACMHAVSRLQAERSSISGCAATTLTLFSSKRSSSPQSIWRLSASTLLAGTLLTSLSATTLLMTGLSLSLKLGGCSSSSLLEWTSAIRCLVMPPAVCSSTWLKANLLLVMHKS